MNYVRHAQSPARGPNPARGKILSGPRLDLNLWSESGLQQAKRLKKMYSRTSDHLGSLRTTEYIWWARDQLKKNALLFSSPLFLFSLVKRRFTEAKRHYFFSSPLFYFEAACELIPCHVALFFSGFVGRGPCLHNVFAQLLLFLSCGACHRPDSKKVSTFFWDTQPPQMFISSHVALLAKSLGTPGKEHQVYHWEAGGSDAHSFCLCKSGMSKVRSVGQMRPLNKIWLAWGLIHKMNGMQFAARIVVKLLYICGGHPTNVHLITCGPPGKNLLWLDTPGGKMISET